MNTKYLKFISSFVSNALKTFSSKLPYPEVIKLFRQEEAKVGGRLFGQVPEGHDRQFFCVDKHTWMFNETYPNGHVGTITYIVKPSHIIARQVGYADKVLRGQELENFYEAVKAYSREVKAMYATLER